MFKGRSVAANSLAQRAFYRRGDFFAMKTAVLNENLVRVHACDDYARQVNALRIALERFGMGVWPLRLRIEPYAERCEKVKIGMIARHCEHKVVLDPDFAFGRSHQHRIRTYFLNRRAEVCADLARFNSIFDIWFDPILDAV